MLGGLGLVLTVAGAGCSLAAGMINKKESDRKMHETIAKEVGKQISNLKDRR